MKKSLDVSPFSSILSLMKNDIKNAYLVGALEGIIRQAPYDLPSSVKRKDFVAFQEKMLQAIKDAENRAEAYVNANSN